MSKILLSVIMPCYNAERFIPGLVQTLEAQYAACEDAPIEFIFVNDGSKDATQKVLTEETVRLPNVQLIDKENEGVSVARNDGMLAARGEYIYFFDCDDSLRDGSLQHYVRTLRTAQSADMYAFGYVSEQGGRVLKAYVTDALNGKLLGRSKLNKNYFSKQLNLSICSCIFRKSFLEDNEIIFSKGIRIGEDIEFLIKAVSRAESTYYSRRICYIYQIRQDSVMQGYRAYSKEQFDSFLLNRRAIRRTGQVEYTKYHNFFLANSYLSNLRYYLRAGMDDGAINAGFIANREVLKHKVSRGRFPNWALIKLARVFPINQKTLALLGKRAKQEDDG